MRQFQELNYLPPSSKRQALRMRKGDGDGQVLGWMRVKVTRAPAPVMKTTNTYLSEMRLKFTSKSNSSSNFGVWWRVVVDSGLRQEEWKNQSVLLLLLEIGGLFLVQRLKFLLRLHPPREQRLSHLPLRPPSRRQTRADRRNIMIPSTNCTLLYRKF